MAENITAGSVNDMGFNQAATLLNEITQQVTGQKMIAPVNTQEFVSVANTVLKCGYDPLLNAIRQMITKTIFSIRPYYRKFPGIKVSNQRWGSITRKLNIVDTPWENDQVLDLKEGESIDQWVVHKPTILETNFYGANMYRRHITIFKNQLDNAFTGPNELNNFFTMQLQNANDQIEQVHESTARLTINNYIGGKLLGDTKNVIHLVTEYNAFTGNTLTPETALAQENFKPFMQWITARIKTLCNLMTERTVNYHINVTGKPIARHTPIRKQKIYLNAGVEYLAQSTVFADVFHDSYLKMADHESVNYWQSVETPMGIDIEPIYTQSDGTLTNGENVKNTHVFGVIFDEETLGYTTLNEYSLATPINAAGAYSNIFFHFMEKYWNDFTENGLVLLLD